MKGAKKMSVMKKAMAMTPEREVAEMSEMSRGAINAVATSAIILIVVQLCLLFAYWKYMQRLEKENCACALTPAYTRVKWTFYAYAALFLLTLLGMGIFSHMIAIIFPPVALLLACLVCYWWFQMHQVKCKCSAAWEKDVWATLSAIYIAIFIVGVGGLGAAATAHHVAKHM